MTDRTEVMTEADESTAVGPIADMWIGEADIKDIEAQIGKPGPDGGERAERPAGPLREEQMWPDK